MANDALLVLSTTVVLASVGASVLVGYEAGRTEQITAAWREGCAQLAKWRAALAPVLAMLLRAYRVVKRLGCAVRWPAHGHHRGHRAGVA